jgi:hypothetical protein
MRHVGTVVGVAQTAVPGFRDLPAIDLDIDIFEAVFGGTYDLTTLKGAKATVNTVHDSLVRLHDTLVPGDTFILAYSGHGSQRPTDNPEEPDGMSEALVLADGEYRDEWLRNALHGFRPGVKVVALIDGCHAAGATFLQPPERHRGEGVVWRRSTPVPGATSLTIAAAPEDGYAMQREDAGGQLTDCIRQAHSEGSTSGTWAELWDAMSSWAAFSGYRPPPQAWLDGPEGSGQDLLDASVFGGSSN